MKLAKGQTKICRKCNHEMDRIDVDVDLKTLKARGGTVFICSECLSYSKTSGGRAA